MSTGFHVPRWGRNWSGISHHPTPGNLRRPSSLIRALHCRSAWHGPAEQRRGRVVLEAQEVEQTIKAFVDALHRGSF